MLRLCSLVFLVGLLAAGLSDFGSTRVLESLQTKSRKGSTNGQTTINRVPRTFNEGDSFTLSVLTMTHTDITKCFAQTPNNGAFEFTPMDTSQSTEKYTVGEGTPYITECVLTINHFDKNDEGHWDFSYIRASDGDVRAEYYSFIINVAEPEEEEDDNVTLLPEINHYTNQEGSIDISLNKESFEEECYVRPPGGVYTKVQDLSLDNVKIQSSSNFVSCRITIDPITEDVLGEWRVCGKLSINDEEQMRCQPANIQYNNGDSTNQWYTIAHPVFRHPVHYGGSVNPAVVGYGEIITCHVVTPDGEDLVITPQTEYPHIQRSAENSLDKCSVVITDIASYVIGDWTIYGKFRSDVHGLNEIRLPMNLALYNENNPYEQAYNITTLDNQYVVNVGIQLDVSVSSTGKVDECSYITPTGEIWYDGSEGVSLESSDDEVACQVSIGPITENMFGEWQLIGKFSDGNLFTEKQLTFLVIQEDPENPIEDEDREIIDMSTIQLDSQMGEYHTITIANQVFIEPESCHIRTANGLQYSFNAGLNLPGVEIISGDGIECGLRVHVTTEDMLGEWTLIARATRLGNNIERRQPFVINVEETNGQQFTVTITEGSDLHLSLSSDTDMFDTCVLYGPFGFPCSRYELDTSKTRSCGYIIRDVTPTQNGTWAIRYGNNIIYRETIDVTVLESSAFTAENLRWTLGSSINISLGPEDAIYCKLQDSDGNTVYDGFGQCQVNVDRVETDHSGVWTIFAGVPGNVAMQEYSFWIDVRGADPAPIITTSVVRNAPVVSLTCSLPSGNGDVRACKFRDPSGKIFVAQHGVGQDGVSTNYESTATSNDCVLRLMNPAVADLGMWRCAMDTEDDTHYAFLTVTCPWLMQDPIVAAGVQTEPVLKQDRTDVSSLEGHSTTLSCSVDASIRYCYFRYRNGTIFNTGPAIRSSGYEYSGAGFHAGECGIKFDHLSPSESGDWTCHVGLMDLTAPEQSVSINVNVRDMMAVSHHYNEHRQLVVEATVHDSHPLDYCRFIRITGQGFTQHNAPEGFHIEVHNGYCVMYIAEPNILDVHPWTVVAKLTGVEAEISRDTMETLVIEGVEPDQPNEPGQNGNSPGMVFFWVIIALLLTIVALIAFALIPKKNREWTMTRVNSLRRTPPTAPFHGNDIVVQVPNEKQPLPDLPVYQERA